MELMPRALAVITRTSISVAVVDGRIQAVRSIVNPEKLGHLGPLVDIPKLFESVRERDR